MDIGTVDGSVYLTTQTDHQVLDPTSSDEGVGALWEVDPATGSHEVVSASPLFRSPSGLTGDGQDGFLLSEWDGQRVLHVNASGEARVVSPVNGSQNLWGIDTLPDGRIVAADAGGIWLVDAATGTAQRLVQASGESEPRHVRVVAGT